MCGICGYIPLAGRQADAAPGTIDKMTSALAHRGPDGSAVLDLGSLCIGFTRLSIIDLAGGMQPLTNEDQSLTLICNGEIFNYPELREDLLKRGHVFRTKTDVEVILHLYEEYGTDLLNRLNGQFAFALYDAKRASVLLARDHFGILPLHYTVYNGVFIFASEIKSILEYPGIQRSPDLVGLDQVFTFPGLVGARTMFRSISSLENGHYLLVDMNAGLVQDTEYWDLIYPEAGGCADGHPESYYTERLNELLDQSLRLRLRSDVPVGCYLSGGLDSSLIASKLRRLTPDVQRYTFSIDFADRTTSEGQFQRLVSRHIDSIHHEQMFLETDVIRLLASTIYHCECPVKESYNTASYSLSGLVRQKNIKVILTGEGADELFGGYVGYKFDRIRALYKKEKVPGCPEAQLRAYLWGNEDFFYEKEYARFGEQKKELYAPALAGNFEQFNCLNYPVVNRERIRGREVLHIRSYVDYKLRMVDHLLSDHGDRMAMANSVEARYPFLDKDLVAFVTEIPTGYKLKDLSEKHIIRNIAGDVVPEPILQREKFGFVAPSSPAILRRNDEYINDILSYDRIRRQGYFNPATVERLRKQYTADGFRLNIPFDDDLLITVITFGVFLREFGMD